MVDLYLKLVTHWDEPSKALLGGNDQLLTDYSSNEELGKFDNVRGMMLMDLITFLPDDLLVKIDRAAWCIFRNTYSIFGP